MPFSPLRKRKRNWKASLEKLQALLTCALCNNHPLKYPVTLSTCCHAFCESCIKENFSNCCPICHKPAILQYPSAVQVPNICNIVQLLAKLRESADMFSFDRTTNRKTIITDNDMHWTGRKTEQQSYLSNRPLGMHAPSMEKLQGAIEPQESVITILPTGLDAKQYMFLKKVITKLGRAQLATSFQSQVTHLVTGHYDVKEKLKRTMKLCIGMVSSNCKIMSFQWLIHCHMANQWIDNTLEFEMRETWIKPGCVFSHVLFCLEQYMGEVPSTSELEQLITLGGGQIVSECDLLSSSSTTRLSNDNNNRSNVQWIIASNTEPTKLRQKYPNIATVYPEQLLDRICLR